MNKELLSNLQNNYKMLYYVVNHSFSIKELMGESYNKGIYCPFHGESRAGGSKPSARFYDNQIPVKLWCFSEHKSYYSYHYIKLIMRRDPLQYLISNTTEKKIRYYMNEYLEENADEEEMKVQKISSLKELENLYGSLDIRQKYDNWYII